MSLMDDDEGFGTLVAENAQWRLWKNDETRRYERSLSEYDENGFTLQGDFFVVLAEEKATGVKTYLMLDKKTQKPYADWTDPITFDFKKKLILIDLKDDCDIVNMANRKKANRKKVKQRPN